MRVSYYLLLEVLWEGVGWGGRLFEAGRSLTFSAFSMGAYSRWALIRAQGPHSHILMTGGSKGFFGSDILAKRDFFVSMKDARIFLGRENNTGIFFGYCIFHQLKSTIT